MSTSGGEVTNKVEETMARVRATIPASASFSPPGVPARDRSNDGHLFPEDLYRSLHQARTIAGGIWVDYALGWRTPIVGQAWMMVRWRIHQEIRIYVDALTTQQNNVNSHLIRSLTQIVETLDGLGLNAIKRRQQEQEGTIANLRAEIQALRSQVEELQARLEQTRPSPRTSGASTRVEST